MRDLIANLILVLEILILVRVLMSWFPGIDPWSPWVRVLRAIVDPVLLPFRRLIPVVGGIDVSPLVALLVLQQVQSIVQEGGHHTATWYVLSVTRSLIVDILVLGVIIVAIRLLISFFHTDPFHPMVRMVRELSRPLVSPFAAVIPRSRQVDLPAAVSLVVLIVAVIVIGNVLESVLGHV